MITANLTAVELPTIRSCCLAAENRPDTDAQDFVSCVDCYPATVQSTDILRKPPISFDSLRAGRSLEGFARIGPEPAIGVARLARSLR
jgi:hypothetical protein